MERPKDREKVYEQIDEEIEYGKKRYEENRPPGSTPDAEKSVLEYILLMEHYLAEARSEGCRDWPKQPALKCIKAVVAFGINCLIYHYDELIKSEKE